jgi:hypothetical protein
MSDLAMTVAVGPADRNSGLPRAVDCLGQLIVGGSGVWVWHDIGNISRVSPGTGIRLRSAANLGLEIAAGIALIMDFGAARVITAETFGAQWNEHDVELDDAMLTTLAKHSFGIPLAVVLTSTDPIHELVQDAIAFITEATEWSLLVCAPQAQRLRTQWGASP